jgi:hypothetical protein
MGNQAAPASTRPSRQEEGTARPVGRPPLLDEQDLQVLMELTVAEPQATIRRLQQRMEQECGKRPSRATMRRAMQLLGVTKDLPPREPPPPHSEPPASAPQTYRYRTPHRREPSRNPRRYPSDLTDEEWAGIEPLVVGPSLTGRPPVHSRRRILDAVLYVLRSGCQWRMLPLDYPP